MRISILVFISFIAGSPLLKAQDSTKVWKTGGFLSVNASQMQLYRWVAGGESSVSGIALFHTFANYKKGDATIDNVLDAALGGLRAFGKGRQLVKTDDRLELSSKFGHYAFKKYWYYSALLNFRTQSLAGLSSSGDTISRFMAPAYGLAALGMDYKRAVDKKYSLTVLIAPVTAKFTIVNDEVLANAGAFGVDKATYDVTGAMLTPGKRFRAEAGGFIRTQFQWTVMQNVGLTTKLDLFSNYLHNPDRIDANWDLLIDLKVNKFISASLITSLIYDDDITNVPFEDENKDGAPDRYGVSAQLKQLFGLGFSYKF